MRKEHEKRKLLRAQLQALPERIDPEWLAFMNTLACSFQPFLFFSNHGPVEFSAHELPFTGTIGTRGAVVTFQGQFGGDDAWDVGLMHDLRFLSDLKLSQCHYGAASCPVHPFVCELKTDRLKLTGADVPAALNVRDFRSEHIADLEATYIFAVGRSPHGKRLLGVVSHQVCHNLCD
jgi:hypothetical protein